MPEALQASLLDAADEVRLRPLAGLVRREQLSAGAWIDLAPGWLTGASELFERLASEVPWHAERRKMYDRTVDVPRLLSFYREGVPLPHAVLDDAREELSAHYAAELGEPFRTAGLCYYRDGRDSVAWHGDTIGRGSTEDTMVAIVSVGAPRALLLRERGAGAHHPARSRTRGPDRDGRFVPAHLGTRGAEDRQAGRAADQHPVPAARRPVIVHGFRTIRS